MSVKSRGSAVGKILSRLRFADDLESEFLEDYYQKGIKQVRVACFAGIFLFDIMHFMYLMQKPVNHELVSQTAAIRFGIVTPIYVFLFILTFTPYFKKYMQEYTSLAMVTMGVALAKIIMLLPPPMNYFAVTGMIIVLMANFSLVKLRFIYATISAWIILFSFLYFAIFVHDVSPKFIFPTMTFWCGTVFIGMLSNYFMETSTRQEFLLNRELVNQKKSAESATRLKDKFISLVSHDLRAPLGGIETLLEISSDSGNKNDVMQAVKGSVKGLMETIDRLLDVDRLQSGELVPFKKFIDGRLLITNSIEILYPLAEKKGVVIINEVSESTRLVADPVLLGEVIQNLVSNAIKFCNLGGSIKIQNSGSDIKKGKNSLFPAMTIMIRDTGVGMDTSTINSLFNSDERNSTLGTAGEGGTGMGLHYSREIMESHGGSIEVESVKGEGSTFRLNLPEMTKLVIIVDDQEVQRRIIRRYICGEFSGIEVMEAENGRDALELMDETVPTLIITDIHMLEMDGIDLLRRIKSDSRTKHVPVILNTALKVMHLKDGRKVESRQFAMSNGADEFLLKPVIPEEFLPRVGKYI